mgnify:FL=1
MKYFLCLFFLISSISYSQERLSDSWQNICDFKTDGSGKSLGLKIKLSIPCIWKQQDGDRPHVIKRFFHSSDSNLLASILTIRQMPNKPSKEDVREMFTQSGLKELCKGLGEFISGRKVIIDGLDSGEIAFKVTREHPVGTLSFYTLQYYFVYEDKMIVLSYSVNSETDKRAKEAFEKFKTLFRGLAGKVVFISQWE